jgi:hypothetical protein
MGNKRKLKNCKTSPFALASLSLVCVFKCRVAQENVDHKNSISPRAEPAACYILTLSQAAFGNTRLAGRSMEFEIGALSSISEVENQTSSAHCA